MAFNKLVTRRKFLTSTALVLGASTLPRGIRYAANAASSSKLQMEQGIQIGDVQAHRVVVWSRSNRPARLLVEYDFSENFTNPVRVRGPFALQTTDYTARVDLTGLPDDQKIFLRVIFQDLSNDRMLSDAVEGYFRTAPRRSRAIRFLWSGDTAGQGWGINPDVGGMKIYEAMRQTRPDFFIHSGDNIYADSPIEETVMAENDQVWHNLVTPEVAKVAETLAEFRGRYKYNLLDENVRLFNAEVPQIWQWDDHEVVNNWSDSKDLTDDSRYTEKNIPLLVARGTRAFLEYAPVRYAGVEESERVYRHIAYGKLLDVFVLDMRSYRAGNSFNRQPQPEPDTAFLGKQQLDWLKQALQTSKAVWKVIASDMPLGLQVTDGMDEDDRPRWENAANGDGPVLGREFEIADILTYIKRQHIQNVVWLTADVHYCAAHYYDPNEAQFKDFDPFWEFVAGPLNAGSFGPNTLDNTFGPQVMFKKAPPTANYSPLSGFQFFGQVDIDDGSGVMTVSLKDIDGKTVFRQKLRPSFSDRRSTP